MFYINVWLTAKDSKDVATIRGHLAEACRLSRQEPGCKRFEVYHSQDHERRFLLCEHWESIDAWRAHRGERAFTEIYEPNVLPLVVREPHISELVE